MGDGRRAPAPRRSTARRSCSSASSSRRAAVGVGELPSGSGLPKSTTSRLVGALERQGLVQRLGDAPPPARARSSSATRAATRRRRSSSSRSRALTRLADASGETINLAVPGPDGVEHLAQEDTAHFVGVTDWVGRRVPFPLAANGKCFLAFGRRRARRGRAASAARGYATSIDELEVGLSALAAPVLGTDGAAVAALSISGPTTRLTAERIERARAAARPARRSRSLSPTTARCRMTHEEILQGLYDNTLVGNAPEVKDLVNQGLEDELAPESMLYDALIPSLEEVGARFERGDFFVPEMLIAARAMQGALDILRPLLAETGAQQVGTYVMGTVKGDVHDIGKNLVNIMLEGAGFTVHDLGVNVAPETFVEQVQEHKPEIVGFSAFLTTTMPMFKANINALEKAGIRDDVIVMVGGAPVTQEYADKVGADGYASDASAAVRLAKDLIERKRSAVPA